MIYKIKKYLRKVVPYDLILKTHKIRAIIAALIYGMPARKLKIIAVAGTKGKTTTVNLIARILEKGGYKTAMLSTANFQIGKQKWLNDVKLTTPSPFYLQRFLKKAVEAKCDYAVIEISSHGLIQHRHWGIKYKTVVITNMMSDHLDYHKTFENYKNSHNALITKDLKNLIVNYDDENSRSFLEFKAGKKIAFSLKGYKQIGSADILVKAKDIILKENGSEFAISDRKTDEKVNSKLVGEFNIYNSLAAASCGIAEGVSIDKIKEGLESPENIPGRLERINEGQKFEVIVDYAHSPDSLENVYRTLKPYVQKRMIAVLGGTGDRDKTYRSKAGALADRYADIVIATNEDPYGEDPESIINQVISGIESKTLNINLFRISDRKEAIKKAVEIAAEGDLVIITGKGSEQFIISGDKKIPWDDRKVAREVLKEAIEKGDK